MLFTVTSLSAKIPANYKWHTIETKYFRILYHQGIESIAAYYESISDDVYKEISRQLNNKLKDKTYLVLINNEDYLNGYANSFPFNHIKLGLRLPDNEYGLDSYKDYYRMLLVHELTHILYVDKNSGFLKFLSYIFGRNPYPPFTSNYINATLPKWNIEGVAVYNESKYTGYGRNNSSFIEMVLRTSIIESNYPDINSAGVNTMKDWPGGGYSYWYGGKFIEFIADRYGETNITKLMHQHGKSWAYLGEYYVPKRVLGKSYFHIWNKEWIPSLIEEYKNFSSKTENCTLLFNKKQKYYSELMPVLSGDNNLYYVNDDGSSGEYLICYNRETKRKKRLLRCNYKFFYDLSKDHKYIVYSHIDNQKLYHLDSDLYLYNVERKKRKRLTKGKRLSQPCFFPDSKNLIAVYNNANISRLVKLDVKTGIILTILEFGDCTQIFEPSVSPDSEKILFSLYKDNGDKNIYILDISTEEYKKITWNKGINKNAIWSEDGSKIFFESDIEGINNIYCYDILKKQYYKITDVYSGAFFPTVSKSCDKMTFSYYTSKGFRLAEKEIKESDLNNVINEPIIFNKNYQHEKQYFIKSKIKSNIKKYNPIHSSLPRYWNLFGDVGFYNSSVSDFKLKFKRINIYARTGGYDALGKHEYQLRGGYDFKTKKPNIDFEYIYSGINPEISIGYYQNGEHLVFNSINEVFLVTRNIICPWMLMKLDILNKIRYSLKLFMKIYYEKRTYSRYVNRNYSDISSFFGDIELKFDSTDKYRYSISRTSGRLITASLHYTDSRYLGNYDTLKFLFNWSEYINIRFLKNNTLKLQFSGGYDFRVDKNRIPFSMGGDFSEGLNLNNNMYIPLRGYNGAKYGIGGYYINCEYRFPIYYPQKRIIPAPLIPFFINDISIHTFFEFGDVFSNLNDIKYFSDTGFSLNAVFIVAYYVNVEVSCTFAWPLLTGQKMIFNPALKIIF